MQTTWVDFLHPHVKRRFLDTDTLGDFFISGVFISFRSGKRGVWLYFYGWLAGLLRMALRALF